MKALSICSLFLLLLISVSAFAQTEKGRLRIGGSFSASRSKTETEVVNLSGNTKTTQTSLAFSPVGGIFLLDGFEIGLSPSVSWVSSSIENPLYANTEWESTNFLFGPYVNYYIGPGEKGKPYVGIRPEIGFGNGSEDVFDILSGETWSVETHTEILSLNVMAGYAIFLNDSYILSFYAGYTHTRYKFERDLQDYEANTTTGVFALGVAVSTTFKR